MLEQFSRIREPKAPHWSRRRHEARRWMCVFAGLAATGCTGDVRTSANEPGERVDDIFGRVWVTEGGSSSIGQLQSRLDVAGSSAGAPKTFGGIAGRAGSAGAAGVSSESIEVPVTSYVALSECKLDPPGADGNYEFVELRGEPHTELRDYWLATLEGDQESNRGQVDVVINLSECQESPCLFDDSGYLLLTPDPNVTAPPKSGSVRVSKELAKGTLENGTTTLLVLQGVIADRTSGADWDANDDGTLELPKNVSIVDAVAWTDGGGGDLTYAPSICGPKPRPQALFRCGNTASVEWQYGQLIGDAASTAIDLDNWVPGGLDTVFLTPGVKNDCQSLLAAQPQGGASAMDGGGGSGAASGALSTSRGGRSGLLPSGGAPASSTVPPIGVGGKLDAPRGGSFGASTAGSSTRAGLSGTGAIPGSGGSGPIVVTALTVGSALNDDWWTASPFPPSAGSHSAGVTSTPGSGNTANAWKLTPPELPSGCTLGKVRSPKGMVLAGAIICILRLIGRMRRLNGRIPRRGVDAVSRSRAGDESKCALFRGHLQERLRRAACSAIRASENVESSDLECATPS